MRQFLKNFCFNN